MSDTEIKEQEPAPDFTLPAVGSDDVVKNGQVHLADLKGRTLVLYFYPKDDTPGCTKEACAFRDANRVMQQRGIVVLGSSLENVKFIKEFVKSLAFPFIFFPITIILFSSSIAFWRGKKWYARRFLGSTPKP